MGRGARSRERGEIDLLFYRTSIVARSYFQQGSDGPGIFRMRFNPEHVKSRPAPGV